MKISVSSYSFSGDINKGLLSLYDCARYAKEYGFDAVEYTDMPGETLEERTAAAKKIRKSADEAGLPISAYSVSAELFSEDKSEVKKEIGRVKSQVDIAAILGADVMRHDVCYNLGKSGNSRSFGLMLPTISEAALEITEYAQKLGIKTCTENHGYIAQDSYRVESLFNAVAHDNYGLLVDIGNFVCADEDNALAVSRVAPYAIYVHIKDMLVRKFPAGMCCNMTRGGNYFCGTVIGEGDVDIKRCLNILVRAGYDGYVSVEYDRVNNSCEAVKQSLINLNKIFDELNIKRK